MKRQVFDEAFKRMAVELSYAKGSVKVVAAELGIDPGRLSKCRQIGQDGSVTASEKPGLTEEQLEIRRLQKELKEAQLERAIWTRCTHRLLVQKRRSASFSRETADIQLYKGAQGSIQLRWLASAPALQVLKRCVKY